VIHRRWLAALLASAVWTTLAAAEDKVVGGPFVVNVGPKTATVAWLVQGSEVKLGAAPNQLTRPALSLHSEKVTYTGLEPGKMYYYSVAAAGAAGTGHFKTPPAGRANFDFAVFGDTRTRHELHKKVIAALVKENPDFVIHTGDLVSDGADTGQWPVFFSIERDLLRKTAFFPCLGNHERNNRQYYEFLDVNFPYYSFDWGAAHIVVLNSDMGNIAVSELARDAFWGEQMRWLENDLEKNAKAELKFVAFHHPPFTAMKSRQLKDERMEDLVALMEKYKVTAVFNGHDHNYQHHLKNGIHYIVTGGGGAPLYDADAPIPGVTQKVARTEHYVRIKVTGNQAKVEAIALDGRTLDAFGLR
jgi:acid phosphatase type 7